MAKSPTYLIITKNAYMKITEALKVELTAWLDRYWKPYWKLTSSFSINLFHKRTTYQKAKGVILGFPHIDFT